MKILNHQQVLEEVFNLLMQQLEPWKVAHFWAIGQGAMRGPIIR